MLTWYETSLRLPAVACDDAGALHRAVWMACRTSASQPERDFLYCAVPDEGSGGSLVRVRSAVARPGWRPRALAQRLTGGMTFAYGRTLDSCRRIDHIAARQRLSKRLEANGFGILSLDVAQGRPVAAPHAHQAQHGGAWWAFTATFVLEVEDRARAEALWVGGVGKGKAFGFGMPVAL